MVNVGSIVTNTWGRHTYIVVELNFGINGNLTRLENTKTGLVVNELTSNLKVVQAWPG